MQRHSAFWLFSLCLALSACGGAGGDGSTLGDPSATAQSAPSIDGVVFDVDDETDLVANIPLVLVETGEVATSDADGAFAFAAVPEGDVTIALGPASPAFATPGVVSLKGEDGRGDEADGDDADDTDGEDDEADDDCERTDRRVILRRLARCERVHVDIRIRGRQIIDVRVTRVCGEGGDACRDRELEIEMTPTDGNPDEDMEGEVEMELDCEGCQKFEVEVEDATAGDVLEAVVIDPEGEEYSLGRREVESDGDAEWRLDTCDDQRLPFGVARLTALERHVVKVRTEDGRNLLCARIPEFPPDDDDHCFSLRGRSRLRTPSDEIQGAVLVRIRGCVDEGFRQYLLIAGKGFDVGQEIEFFLEDPDEPGTLVSIGTVLANEDGEAAIDFDTGDGDELPFGVTTLRELVGMQIRVKDDVTGALLLAGRVPGLLRD